MPFSLSPYGASAVTNINPIRSKHKTCGKLFCCNLSLQFAKASHFHRLASKRAIWQSSYLLAKPRPHQKQVITVDPAIAVHVEVMAVATVACT